MKTSVNAKPFLKWAGGKSQLLSEIVKRLPPDILRSKVIERYIEPFLGGGALFFFLRKNYQVKEAFILDINSELIIAYKTIQHSPEDLIKQLKDLQEGYLRKSPLKRETYYYQIREMFNKQINNFDQNNYKDQWVRRTAWLIFLNKTCYNGLFRKNSKGRFNVPFGRYKRPTICNEDNILAVNRSLQNTTILQGDFSESERFVNNNSLVYLDPPYRPLNKTSSFTGYSEFGFTDGDQERLSQYYNKMSKKGAFIILSNSDPRNENRRDTFFDDLYMNFNIERVNANRMINSNGAKRGKVTEILVANYG